MAVSTSNYPDQYLLFQRSAYFLSLEGSAGVSNIPGFNLPTFPESLNDLRQFELWDIRVVGMPILAGRLCKKHWNF